MIVIATLFRKLQTVKDLVRPLFKKHRFRNSFDNQYVKESQSLVKSAWEHFHHIFSSLSETLIWKISHLVISSILGLFRNTLTANDNYPVGDSRNLLSPIQMQLSLKPKFFDPFLESTSNFTHFEKMWKKRWSPYLLYFEISRMWKTWLDHSLKNTVKDYPLTVNMLKGPKLL